MLTPEEKYNQLKKDYDEFVYIVSHDFRASFRKISSLTGWMKDDLESEDLSDMEDNIKLLQRTSLQMDGMLHGLTLLSRIDRIEKVISEVNIETLIKQILEENKLIFNKVDISGQINSFNTNKEKFKNILTEILKNAHMFNTNEQKELLVNWIFSNEKIILEIKDNGFGIDNKDLEKPFKLFYNEHFKTRIETTGSGLTYALKLAQSENGTVEIISSTKEGSTIQIKL
jgi:light-regulated signal transduction histidine kinase (bacteriophytochrome)